MTKNTLDDFSRVLKTLDARYQHLAALMVHQVKVGDSIAYTLTEVKFLHAEIRSKFLPIQNETLH